MSDKLRNVRVVNCTPHPVTILDAASFLYKEVKPTPRVVFPPSNYVARVEYRTSLVERLLVENNVIDVTTTKYTTVLGLPDPKRGVVYIVSKLVAEALFKERGDLYILSGITRTDQGKILGGRSLAKLQLINASNG